MPGSSRLHIGRLGSAVTGSTLRAHLDRPGTSCSAPGPPPRLMAAPIGCARYCPSDVGSRAGPLIEDYALLSDLQTAALVHRRGSVDWCCFPRFDSDACFAALLGDREHGRWVVAPDMVAEPRRHYRHGSLVLETEWEAQEGKIRVIDFMPPRRVAPTIVRLVE